MVDDGESSLDGDDGDLILDGEDGDEEICGDCCDTSPFYYPLTGCTGNCDPYPDIRVTEANLSEYVGRVVRLADGRCYQVGARVEQSSPKLEVLVESAFDTCDECTGLESGGFVPCYESTSMAAFTVPAFENFPGMTTDTACTEFDNGVPVGYVDTFCTDSTGHLLITRCDGQELTASVDFGAPNADVDKYTLGGKTAPTGGPPGMVGYIDLYICRVSGVAVAANLRIDANGPDHPLHPAVGEFFWLWWTNAGVFSCDPDSYVVSRGLVTCRNGQLHGSIALTPTVRWDKYYYNVPPGTPAPPDTQYVSMIVEIMIA